ncbi:hypothetical protein BJ742DRAFT_736522 [Cladochytrium replicatum]|nr:hypothetical protein BJ742DRAFT_736522 [Cladochytrium replicatum]
MASNLTSLLPWLVSKGSEATPNPAISIPLPGGSNSSAALNSASDAAHNMYKNIVEGLDENGDLASFALQHYMLALLSCPVEVVLTLSEVQFQRRGDEESYDPANLDSYVSVAASTVKYDPSRLPPLDAGFLENLHELVENENEGWMALLKGHFTYFCQNIAFQYLQPALEEGINDILDVFEDRNPWTYILSNVVVGGFLSPLELARTRLIVQASSSSRRKYYGPIHALHAVASENNAYSHPIQVQSSSASSSPPKNPVHSPSVATIGTLYAPRHLIPSLLIHAIRPSLRLLSESILSNELGLSSDFNPILFRVSRLGMMLMECAILTPFEIARKRLQVQRMSARIDYGQSSGPQEPATPFDAVVEVQTRYYSGLWDTIGSIIQEEGAAPPIVRRTAKRARKRGLGSGYAATEHSDWQTVTNEEIVEQPTDRMKKTGSAGSVNPWSWDGDETAFGPSSSASSARSSVQNPRASTIKEKRKPSSGGGNGGVWKGVKSVYRGFWARYAQDVVAYVFSEMSSARVDEFW